MRNFWHLYLGFFNLRTITCLLQGQKHGAKIVLRGEAGCSDPSVQPGDVVFVLEQKEHRFFKRINQVTVDFVVSTLV